MIFWKRYSIWHLTRVSRTLNNKVSNIIDSVMDNDHDEKTTGQLAWAAVWFSKNAEFRELRVHSLSLVCLFKAKWLLSCSLFLSQADLFDSCLPFFPRWQYDIFNFDKVTKVLMKMPLLKETLGQVCIHITIFVFSQVARYLFSQ